MDNMSLIYNTNLCRICQIPDNLDLISTSAITNDGETYLNLLKYTFNDIPWTEDTLISLACHICIKKIKDASEFKHICLESNNRRSVLNSYPIKLEINTTDNNEITDDDKEESEVEIQPAFVKLEEQSSNKEKARDIADEPKSKVPTQYVVRKPRGQSKKDVAEVISKLETDDSDRLKCKPTGGRCHLCDICQTECKNQYEFDRHMNKHNGSRNYVCNVCGRTYITRDDLKQHSYRHNTEATYVCEICPGKKFKTNSNLRTHKKLVHMNKKDFKYLCTECGQKFPQLGMLRIHIKRRHNTVRDFKCGICGKAFVEKSVLKDHYLTHTNVRPYKCDLCPADYKRRDELCNHKTKCHGIGNYKFPVEKKYDCSYCGRKMSKVKLKRHIRTHTGVKPYSCRLCDMKFICNSYVKGHLKSKHDIDVQALDYDTKLYYDMTEEAPLEDPEVILKGSCSFA